MAGIPDLYHCLSARSFRPLWVLEALGMPYRLHVLPFPPRAHDRSYLQINPLGTVPALRAGDALMTESMAICQYLVECAAASGREPAQALDVRAGEADHAAYLNFVHYGEATLTVPQTLVLRYGRLEPAERRQAQVVEDYRRWFLARTRLLAAWLEDRAWLCGGRLTLADVSVGYALMLADHLGLLDDTAPAVQAYWQRLSGGEAFGRALAAERRAAQAQGIDATPAPLAG